MDEKMNTGLSTTIVSFLLGMIPSVTSEVRDTLTFWFQLIAFGVTIIAGILTICYTLKKFKQHSKP